MYMVGKKKFVQQEVAWEKKKSTGRAEKHIALALLISLASLWPPSGLLPPRRQPVQPSSWLLYAGSSSAGVAVHLLSDWSSRPSGRMLPPPPQWRSILHFFIMIFTFPCVRLSDFPFSFILSCFRMSLFLLYTSVFPPCRTL
jgi:hypothetical protein